MHFRAPGNRRLTLSSLATPAWHLRRLNTFESPKLTRRNIGEYIKADQSALGSAAASVQYGMRWGKGLEQINDEIEACLNNTNRRSRERCAPAIIVVSYAGNDVWGKHGFVGNTWIDSRSVHRNPAVARAASEWQVSWLESILSSSLVLQRSRPGPTSARSP